jgi:hypothetical protein
VSVCTCPPNGALAGCALHGDEEHRRVQKRRGFLRGLLGLAVVGVAPSAVIPLVRARPVEGHQLFHGGVGRYEGLVIKRHQTLFDYGRQVGICVSVTGGKAGKIRLAAKFMSEYWDSFNGRLRQRYWNWLERGAVRAALGEVKS